MPKYLDCWYIHAIDIQAWKVKKKKKIKQKSTIDIQKIKESKHNTI